jgi:hypothetical protein
MLALAAEELFPFPVVGALSPSLPLKSATLS